MSLVASIARSDLKLELAELQKSLLHRVGIVGTFKRQIEGGTADVAEIRKFIENERVGVDPEQEEMIEELQKAVDRIDRRLERVERAKPQPVPPPSAATGDAVVALEEIDRRIEALRSELDTREEGRKVDVDASMEALTGLARRVQTEIMQAVEAGRRTIEETVAAMATNDLADRERAGEDGGHVIRFAPGTFRHRSKAEGKPPVTRPKASPASFTSAHPRFQEATTFVRSLLDRTGRPVEASVIVTGLREEYPAIDFVAKDIGNRLNAMGLVRVAVDGSDGAKPKAAWWIPGRSLPAGYSVR